MHFSINLAFDDQSPTKHEEIANCIKAGEATEGQLMVQKGFQKNTKMWSGFSWPLFLVESGVINIDVYLQTLYKHIIYSKMISPSQQQSPPGLSPLLLVGGVSQSVYDMHVYMYRYQSLSTSLLDFWAIDCVDLYIYSTPKIVLVYEHACYIHFVMKNRLIMGTECDPVHANYRS